ncbi:hypothetical protein FOL47_008168 [Perkinsus chesapeaki]|uniref:Amino acid transporter transmembrane domain-containing protein n=1 Tax=Perkinsus chesapeaki TaxID=330153 RepID=A0A7J6MW92_PERCH|nr:hypothetical protein FOL47_008168 [Perkinsus chesapeaki]
MAFWRVFLAWLSAMVCRFQAQGTVSQPMRNFRCPLTPKWTRVTTPEPDVNTYSRSIQNLDFTAAKQGLRDSLSRALDPLNEAFDCSIGIASAYRVLAIGYAVGGEALDGTDKIAARRAYQIALRMMHVGMNWLTHAFVVKGKNDGYWIDESDWPITIQQMNDEQTAIQNAILKSGPHGHTPTWEEVPSDFRDHNISIAIVTMCDYPEGHVLPRYSLSNKELYSNRHGYTVIAESKRDDPSRPHAWAKISLMLKHVKQQTADWLLWFDCDTYFMDLSRTLDSILYKFGSEVSSDGRRRVRDDFHMLIQEDHAMLNTGVFFVRTSDWVASMLTEVYGGSTSPWINHPWWENAAFSHWFLGSNYQRLANENHIEFMREAASDMDGIYPEKVIVAPQVDFNSYHPITSRIFQHDTWEPGKFVLAFSGVQQASSPTVVSVLYGNYYRIMCRINKDLFSPLWVLECQMSGVPHDTGPRQQSVDSAALGTATATSDTINITTASSMTSITSSLSYSSPRSSIAASLATSGGLTRRSSRVSTMGGLKRSASSTEDATAATISDSKSKVLDSSEDDVAAAEGSVPEPTGTILSLWTVLSKTMIGVGMLGLAYSVSRCGWVIGILAIIISALASLFTLHLLNRCALMLEVVGNMLEPLISRWIPIIPETIGSFATRAILILICVAIVSPVCFWSLLYVVIIGIVYSDCSKADENTTVWPPANFWTVMGVLPIIIMSFGCHMNAFLVTDDLKNRTQKRVDIVSTAAIATALVIFIPAMVFPYVTFGYNVEALSLQNLSVNYVAVQIGYLALAVSDVCSFPLQVFPCRRSLTVLLTRGKELKPKAELKLRVVLTVCIVLIALVVAIFVNSLGVTFSLLGLIGGDCTSFIMPCYLYCMLTKDKIKEEGRVTWYTSAVVFVIGVVIFPICLYGIIYTDILHPGS